MSARNKAGREQQVQQVQLLRDGIRRLGGRDVGPRHRPGHSKLPGETVGAKWIILR